MPTSDGQHWRNVGCFCLLQCLPESGQAAREALAERSKADLCHSCMLLQRNPRAPVASQPGLSNIGVAFLLRVDMEISPRWRCFGGGNRNVCEQTGSAARPICTDKAPSRWAGCSSVSPSAWHQGEEHPQALGPRCTPPSTPALCRTEPLPRGTTASSPSA